MSKTGNEFLQRVNCVLLMALERPPDERAAFLDRQCNDDGRLRHEVDSLLAADTESGQPIDQPVIELLRPSPEILQAGDCLGAYRILVETGRGGTGVVYLATSQCESSPNKVAIKVLKHGMDTDQILRAFRQERRILANLDHPAIARFYDSGVTSDQRPYLVMEYVDGVPIDRYCDAHSLGVRERVELFLEVCGAVQRAHQNLVIHRDLKPSNILVSESGTPKLLDFGIAKLLHPDTIGAAPVTAAARRLMTPRYASPEQVQGEAMTTASDVYSLGVVLYELLTGRRPYRIESDLETDIREVICRHCPLEPSLTVHRRQSGIRGSRALASDHHAPKPAHASRGVGARRLQRQLAGDLDNIVLMALHKRPQDRYSSADQLASDLRCHLGGMPVSARKPTWTYRAGKFLRRHPKCVASAAGAALLVVGFAGHRELQQRRTSHEHDRSRQISAFLSDLFDIEADDLGKPRSQLTARDLLDRGTERIDRQLHGQPRVQAELMVMLARGYGSLGHHAAATPLAERALSLRREVYGSVHPEVAESLDLLAGLEVAMGDYRRAETLTLEELDIHRRLLGDKHPTVIRARHAFAMTLMDQGRYIEAEPILRDSLRSMEQLEGKESQSVAAIRGNLAILLYYQGEYNEAEVLYRQALDTSRELLGNDHPQVSANKVNLATCLRDLDRYDAAERLYRETLATYREQLGKRHPANAAVQHNLAVLMLLRGDLAESKSLLLDALATGREFLGKEHPTYANYRVSLARLLLAEGDAEGAESIARSAHSTLHRRMSADHRQTQHAQSVLGASLARQGRFQKAEPLLTESHRWLSERLSPRTVAARDALLRVIELYDAWGQLDKATAYRGLLDAHSKGVVEPWGQGAPAAPPQTAKLGSR